MGYRLRVIGYGFLLTLCVLHFTACEPPQQQECVLHVMVSIPDTLTVSQASLSFEDRNMGTVRHFTEGTMIGDTCIRFDVTIPVGYYACVFNATANKAETYTYSLRAYNHSVSLTAESTLELQSFVGHKGDDFVLAEIFFAGTQTPQGKQYTGDKYFVLVNNSYKVLYADGIVLVESKFKNTNKYEVTPNIRDSVMAVDAVYRVPGNGSTFPVQPGASFIIADNALDHRTVNSNSFNMQDADVEWYDVSTNATVTDIDNPDVPNMDKIYCYTLTIWIPNNQGNTTFAIGRMPDDLTQEEYLTKYRYDYTYINVTQAGTFEMSGSAYKFPNEWIIDAVNLCPHSAYQWLVVHESLDAGFAFVGETGSDKTRYGKCVRRKVGEDGKLIDTNNSSEDFEMVQPADPHFWR